MSKIKNAFVNGKALIAFLTCGDPDTQTTLAAIRAAEANGADMIELGIPFSDPTAEGPAVQEASIRALTGGMTTDKAFAFVRRLREETQIPVVFVTYANVVFSYGAEKFISACGEIGVDGLLLPDLPYEEKDEFAPLCTQYGVDLISQLASNSTARASMIAREAQGFIDLTARAGDNGGTDCPDSILAAIPANAGVPFVIDAEAAAPGQAKAAAALADGIVVREAIVGLMGEYGKDAPGKVGALVRSLKDAMK